MLTRPLLLALSCCTLVAGNAQTDTLMLFHNEDTMIWSDHFVLEMANTDMVEIGRVAELSPDTNYLIFRRFSADGTLLAATRTIPPTGIALQIQAGTELPNGDLMLFGADFPRAVHMRLGPMGELLSVFRDPGSNGWYQCVVQLNDSTVLAAGNHSPSGGAQLLLSRFDASGQHLGSTGLQMANNGANAVSAIRAQDGGVLLCASGYWVTDSSWTNVASTVLVKLDQSAQPIWAKRFTDPERMFHPAGLGEDDTGRILLAGTIWSIGQYSRQYVLVTDPSGEPLFARELVDVLDTMADHSTRGFLRRVDGGLLLTGYGMTGGTAVALDAQAVLTQAIHIPAVHTIDKPILCANEDLLLPVAATAPQSGAALGIWRTSDPFAHPCATPFLLDTLALDILVDTAFTSIPITKVFDDITSSCSWGPSNMTASDPCLPSGAGSPERTDVALEIWPSPTHGPFSLRLPAASSLDIFDATGHLVRPIPVNGTGSYACDIGDLSSGLYVVRAVTANGTRTGRIVKE